MKSNYRSVASLANAINIALKAKQLTLRECVDIYNNRYINEISNGEKSLLNKDFIQRVRSRKYKVVSQRIIDLCIFLEIDPFEHSSQLPNYPELEKIENLIHEHPEFRNHLSNLIQNICDFANDTLRIKKI
ncbi:hypothetical protein [Snodgrassella communis]|uniref:hypothetical protein n=1 Tax=Snodgrassella communis TaxID=2946699 RepID=UPI000C1E15D1|nr:hypothetical protein [Snodgrassella communis]PIT20695.1 hypothetical protein BGI35_07540 [Snodgrassella communis]